MCIQRQCYWMDWILLSDIPPHYRSFQQYIKTHQKWLLGSLTSVPLQWYHINFFITLLSSILKMKRFIAPLLQQEESLASVLLIRHLQIFILNLFKASWNFWSFPKWFLNIYFEIIIFTGFARLSKCSFFLLLIKRASLWLFSSITELIGFDCWVQ